MAYEATKKLIEKLPKDISELLSKGVDVVKKYISDNPNHEDYVKVLGAIKPITSKIRGEDESILDRILTSFEKESGRTEFNKKEFESQDAAIIGVKKALKLAKEIEDAKYLFVDQNGDWRTSETYLYDFSDPDPKVDVGRVTMHPKNAKTLGTAGGDASGMATTCVWDIATGKKMFPFETPKILKESYLFNDYMKFLKESVQSDKEFSKEFEEFMFKQYEFSKNKDLYGNFYRKVLGKVGAVGTYVINVYPLKVDHKVTVCLSLISPDDEMLTILEKDVTFSGRKIDNDFIRFAEEYEGIFNQIKKIHNEK